MRGDCMSSAVPKHVPRITEIKQAIPAHCFKSDLAKSMYHSIKDLTMCFGLYALILLVDRYELPAVVCAVAYPVYWFLQGTIFWAIFWIAHDCGHGSFSSYTWINDTVGNLLDSLVLVPYYPWKLSHRHHHQNGANIDKDESFYPIREKYCSHGMMEIGKGSTFHAYFGLGLGWILYLLIGFYPRRVCHWNPLDPMFIKHAFKCSVSLLCNAVWILILINYANNYGFGCLLTHYLIPYFIFCSLLVISTFLHHHGENIPWYSDHKWDFVRGSLSAVDRDYGWANDFIHNLGLHQVHHLFTKIPHYHLKEATLAFREKYPDLVRKSDAPIISEFIKRYRIFRRDAIIPNDREIHVFGGIN